MRSFLAELKRRNVLRVAAAYAVVAWIIIEAGSVLLPTFGASPLVFRIYVLVVIVGFLVSLVFAWVFEVTPEGVKLEKNVDRSQSITPKTGRKLDFAIIGLLIVALGVSVTFNVTGVRNTEAGAASSPDRLSVAVLPFESRSTDPDNELFADGIHDDLLTRLANIGALRVISRTSVMEYRNSTKNLRQIADELGVGTVLEGAVQRVGDNVRINAQLIDAKTDEHLWAKSYDRQLSIQNIFAIQSEISEAIASALKTTLSSEEHTRLAEVPTENMAAYSLYMQGRANLYERRLETLLRAREQFKLATELDPEFAEAYAGLADSALLLFNNHMAISRDEALTVAKDALDRALSLKPNLSAAYASLGLLKQKTWEDTRSGPGLEEAEAAYLRAIKLNPNNPQAYMWLAAVCTEQEKFDEAIELYNQALRVDPLGRIPYANLPLQYAMMGQFDEALALYAEAVRIHPEWPTAYQNLSEHLQGLGRLDEAIAWGRKGEELSTDPLAATVIIGPYLEFGGFVEVRQALAKMPVDHPLYQFGVGINYLLDFDFPAAVAAFEAIASSTENPRRVMYDLIATTAVLAADYDKARDYTERGHPEFTADAAPLLNRFNVADAIRYAFILQKLGEKQRAESLLAAALQIVRALPRLGIAGHGIRDVQILALQGKPFEALTALREAIDQGFRGTVFANGWPLTLDPYLDSIRDRQEFQAMAAEIDQAVLLMQQKVADAESRGNWDQLRAIANSG